MVEPWAEPIIREEPMEETEGIIRERNSVRRKRHQ